MSMRHYPTYNLDGTVIVLLSYCKVVIYLHWLYIYYWETNTLYISSTCTNSRQWLVLQLSWITPLSTMFQFYHGSHFYLWRKQKYPEKTIDLFQVSDFLRSVGRKVGLFFIFFTMYMNSNPAHCAMYSMQHYVIKFVTDLEQVDSFLRVLLFPPQIKVTAVIKLKHCWKWRYSR
jgi:hypothetical protein